MSVAGKYFDYFICSCWYKSSVSACVDVEEGDNSSQLESGQTSWTGRKCPGGGPGSQGGIW